MDALSAQAAMVLTLLEVATNAHQAVLLVVQVDALNVQEGMELTLLETATNAQQAVMLVVV